MTDPYENLANAIVLQAVKDYRKRSPVTKPPCRMQWSVNDSSAQAGTKP